jgi:hypothetical protein
VGVVYTCTVVYKRTPLSGGAPLNMGHKLINAIVYPRIERFKVSRIHSIPSLPHDISGRINPKNTLLTIESKKVNLNIPPFSGVRKTNIL